MTFASHVDFISPDVYLNDYNAVCRTYRHRGQPLFVPEQRRDEYGASRLWRAIGTYAALGMASFGIDDLVNEPCAYTNHFDLLASVSDLVLDAQRRQGAMQGFFFEEPTADSPDRCPELQFQMGRNEVTIQHAFVVGQAGPGFSLIIFWKGTSIPTAQSFSWLARDSREVQNRYIVPQSPTNDCCQYPEPHCSADTISSSSSQSRQTQSTKLTTTLSKTRKSSAYNDGFE